MRFFIAKNQFRPLQERQLFELFVVYSVYACRLLIYTLKTEAMLAWVTQNVYIAAVPNTANYRGLLLNNGLLML